MIEYDTSSARPGRARAEVSKIGHGCRKWMAYRKVFAMQKHWSVEVVRCINEWANGCWDANEMTWKNPRTNEWMNQWTNESKNQWINESVSQWISESMKQWLNESSKQWTNESMNQWISNSMNQWTKGSTIQSVSQWINESLNQWINEWRNWAAFMFQKCSAPFSFLRFLCEIELSLQSRAHFASFIV